jgi:hypothetical protein
VGRRGGDRRVKAGVMADAKIWLLSDMKEEGWLS